MSEEKTVEETEETEETQEDREYENRISRLRALGPIRISLEKARKPKYKVDPSIRREIRMYFGAFLSSTGKRSETLPEELCTKKDVNDFIAVLEKIQADKDRVGRIRFELEDLQRELQTLWDLSYNYLVNKDINIRGLRSIELRDRAVKHVMLDLWMRLDNVNSLVKNCDDVMNNLQSTYYTASTMLKAAEFSISYREA